MNEQQNNNGSALVALQQSKENFVAVMNDANALDIVGNVAGAFDAAIIIGRLEEVMSTEVMQKVFMPLQGRKIGFRTDKIYAEKVVRDCIIDAAANGLMPTGNQFNIISGTMYPTKEGFTALLAKLKATRKLRYKFEFDSQAPAKSNDPSYMAIPCKFTYDIDGEDGLEFPYTAMVKSNGATSSTDQLRGKAERKAKKAFYEYLTGIDLGEADATEVVEDAKAEVISTRVKKQESTLDKAKRVALESRVAKMVAEFAKIGVREDDICAYLGVIDTTEITDEHVKEMCTVYKRITENGESIGQIMMEENA